MKKLWKVTRGILGADKPVDLYFKNESEANEYYENHDYCDNPESIKVDDSRVDDYLEGTNYYL